MTDKDLAVDTRKLYGLLQAMTPHERLRHAKRALSAAARALKKRAEENLLGSLKHVSNRTSMRSTIWTKIYQGGTGFRVTVAGNSHPYHARQRDLPLGRWLEDGTTQRDTKGGKRKAQRTGALDSIGFLGRAVEELGPGIENNLEEFLLDELAKTAKKYGCI